MENLDTCTKPVDAMPILQHYMKQLRLYELLDRYIPNSHGADIPPAQVLCMLTMNLLHAPSPLYQIPQWLDEYLDGLGEASSHSDKYNDDRSARDLDRLFAADRGSLLAELSARAIEIYHLDTSTFHNDTTSITLQGAYDEPEQNAAEPRYGYNKDHRPDCKQLVFGLNVTGDGHVPLSYKLDNGNQSDVKTHQPNWQALRRLLGKSDFIYVADSKLCAQDNLDTIAQQGGHFITIVPRNFKQVTQFLVQVRAGFDIPWTDHISRPAQRKKGMEQHYQLFESPEHWQGYRMIWVHSSSKAALEASHRERNIHKAETSLTELNAKLNHYQLKSRQNIDKALKKALGSAAPLFEVELIEHRQTVRVKKGPGRPGAQSQYEDKESITFELNWNQDEEVIAAETRTDGLFPLVHNTERSSKEILRIYKEQPHLEKRFSAGKSILKVAPVFLKNTRRIEAIVFLYFIALMLLSLIERNIRNQMEQQNIKSLPIRPSKMKTDAPTWRVIRQFFGGVNLAMILQNGNSIHSTLKGLTPMHEQVLQLLGVPPDIYHRLRDGWWQFKPT